MLFAIHDLAGIGGCSLAVVIPTVAALGVELVPIPTAVLSTHTGGFGQPASVDLTQYMWDTLVHYQKLEIAPKAIFTGYLANEEQIECCSAYFVAYPMAIPIVDPVLGDGGKAYSGISDRHIEKMKILVGKSQILLPNLTECSLLLGHVYRDSPSLEQCLGFIQGFLKLGASSIVIKGIPLENDKLGNLIYDSREKRYFLATAKKLPISFPGTGDIFASVVAGEIVRGKSLRESVSLATGFLSYTINNSLGKNKRDIRFGVSLEECLPWLCQAKFSLAEEINIKGELV